MKKPIKLSSEINIFISLLLFIVILFQTIICIYCVRLVNDKKTAWKSVIIRDVENYVSDNLKELDYANRRIIKSEELIAGLKSDAPNYDALREKIYGIQEYSSGIIHAAAFTKAGEMTAVSGNISDREAEAAKNSFLLYMQSKKDENEMSEEEYYDFFDFSDGGYYNVYFLSVAPVVEHNYRTASNEVVGYLCTFIQPETVSLLFDYDEVSGIDLTLMSQTGRNVLISDSGVTKNPLFTESWTEKRIAGTTWYIRGSITLSAGRIDWMSFIMVFILESLILVAVILAFSHILKHRTIAPLKEIGKFMRRFRISDSFKPITVNGNAELIELAGEVNKMVKRNKVLANDIMLKQGKLYEAENLKNEATLYALQNQVNPHYLYNIFELIRSIALVRGVSEIETISVCVSGIFRYNLKKENTALISDELEITKKYVSIMRVKYGDSFDVIYDLAPDTLNKRTMKMIFQPIIENAFGHGYVRREEKFFVKIKSRMEDNTLHISFYDNGLGMTQERLAEIRGKLSADNYSGGKGIGVTNLAHRLKMMYGENCTFAIESKKDKYTEVKITIPEIHTPG